MFSFGPFFSRFLVHISPLMVSVLILDSDKVGSGSAIDTGVYVWHEVTTYNVKPAPRQE